MDNIEVRRSARRRRSVTAYREGDRTIVLMPAHLTSAQEQEHIERLMLRLDRGAAARKLSDDDLMAKALQLSAAHLDARAVPTSVRWVTNQRKRWGSCTPATGAIRLSHRVSGMPTYVRDYVLLHELAHLVEPNHGPEFWALLEPYPHLDRARGFLDGAAWAS